MNVWHGDEDGNLEECKLLSGGFAALLQILLGFIALSVLIVKRYQEVPQRPLTIWSFDASKQLVGAGFAHVANLLIAILLYNYENGPSAMAAAAAAVDTSGVDQCAFYFVNFTMDTTVGVVLNWIFLEMVSSLAARCHWTALMVPGDYGNPIQISIWLKQLISWVVVIFATKLVIALVIIVCEKPLAQFAIWLFAPLQPHPHIELALVMIACPCLMNAVQFWVQDSFLKKDVRADCMLAPTLSPDKAEMMEKATAGGKSARAAAAPIHNLPPVQKRFVIDENDDEDDDDDVVGGYGSDDTIGTPPCSPPMEEHDMQASTNSVVPGEIV